MTAFSEFGTEALAALEKIGVSAESFVLTEADKGLLFLKANEPLYTKALNIVSDLESSELTGAERQAKLLADIEDEANEFLTEGGFSGIVAKTKGLLATFGESVFTDFKNAIAAA